jgi:hypothetical protein
MNEEDTVKDNHSDQKSDGKTAHSNGRVKRRDLLLGGGSLAALSALGANPLPNSARAELLEYKPGTTFPGRMGRTIGESSPAWPAPIRAKPGAPNVLFIVIDDTGFGQLGCYGSPINTPNLDKLAKNGLLYTKMHTTALCSPSRSCMLTGRNHHSNAMALSLLKISVDCSWTVRDQKHVGFPLSGPTLVAMMQTPNLGEGNDFAAGGKLYATRPRAVLAEREMRSGVLMVLKIARQHAAQMALVEDDDVIQTFPADRTDETLRIGVLPRTSRRGDNFRDPHRPNAMAECRAIGFIAVPQ